jgi:4-aminobutyrate--pyruvate transaminase
VSCHGSYQPIAAVLINESIFEGIADQSHTLGTFSHGFTGTGHPVATAVALENLKILEEESLVSRTRELGEVLNGRLSQYAQHPDVFEVRGQGLIAAVELHNPDLTRPPGAVGRYLAGRAQHYGLIVRSIGDSIAFCPPLISNDSQIRDLVGRFDWAFQDTVVRAAIAPR